MIAHKLLTTIAKNRKRVGKSVTDSEEPQLKKSSVDTDGIDINTLIGGSGIMWTNTMIGESILQLHEGHVVDESIKSYEYDEYQTITGTQLNSAGQIAITIENQDQFLHNSYLLIEGDVLKADSTKYADADLVAPTMDFVYLFSSMKLTLAGQMVEHVN